MDIKEVKRKLNLNNSDIAKMFGYKNPASYQNSNKRKWIENGIVELFRKFKEEQF